jgi:phosphoserine phosphatase
MNGYSHNLLVIESKAGEGNSDSINAIIHLPQVSNISHYIIVKIRYQRGRNMVLRRYLTIIVMGYLILLILATTSTANSELSENRSADPLPSWKDGLIKAAIISFVANSTNESHPDYVAPEERIATFDNDGTLLCELPDVVQVSFMLDRIREMAPKHPEWNNTEPFSSILFGDRFNSANFSLNETIQIYITTSANLTSDQYIGLAKDWLNKSQHPRFSQPYTKCVYKPMQELLSYLRSEGFKIYIVTGGDEDFVRSFSDEIYGIPPEQVIGSAPRVQFVEDKHNVSVVKLPQILGFDDGQEKVKEIVQDIGLRPIFAYGNSDGDIPMLQYATSDNRRGMGLLNHHDDPIREYAYDRQLGAMGKLDKGLDMAGDWGWQVVSMKDDWKEIWA